MIMGIIVEKTNSKWGKSRPWILWMSVPYALSAILLFTVPHTMGMVQAIYIFVTYNFCTTICYTAINLPYGSLSADDDAYFFGTRYVKRCSYGLITPWKNRSGYLYDPRW